MTAADESLPTLSVVIPARNEGAGVEDAVRSVLSQDYPPGRLEVVAVIGPSGDDTREVIASLAAGDSRLRLIDNPDGSTPRALNLGIMAAEGKVIARVDAHGWIDEGYLRAGVEALLRTGAAATGGVARFFGDGPTGEAVALAMGSRLGAGTAAFRTAKSETEADGVMWGFWRRALFDQIGLFDESLLRNQDDELCHRIRLAGGRLIVTPDARFSHRARSTYRALAEQYWQWGTFRAATLRKHRRPATFRQIVPPAIVAVTVPALLALGLTAGRSGRARLVLAAYGGGVVLAGTIVAIDARRPKLAGRTAAAIATMQLSYGAGLIAGWLRSARGPSS